MKKFKLEFDYEKEEIFLNEMAAEGYAMTKFTEGLYDFAPCDPCKYIYRIAYIGGMSDEEIGELVRCQFMKGAELVFKMPLWAYFRSTEPFEIYTDEEKIEVAGRVQKLFTIMGLIAACVSVIFTTLCAVTKRKGWLIPAIPAAILAGFYAFVSFIYLKKQQGAVEEISEEELPEDNAGEAAPEETEKGIEEAPLVEPLAQEA